MAAEGPPLQPSLPWRAGSSFVMGSVGFLCRAFLLAGNSLEVNGIDKFLELLDRRQDTQGRERGLISVSNHTSVLDDPLMWGAIPFRRHWFPDNSRWSMGSHDIVFKNKSAIRSKGSLLDHRISDKFNDRAFSTFFLLGQTLPTHRIAHSQFGGLFQPTMTEIIRLLSHHPFSQGMSKAEELHHENAQETNDPFTDPSSSTYTSNNLDSIPSPSYYTSRRHAWIHVFPEGRIHQRADKTMRYFKWGVARLILEADPAPTLVPIWIEGFDEVMHESRNSPRFVPRIGKKLSITFGESVETEELCGDLRRRWQELVRLDTEKREKEGAVVRWQMGVIDSENLRTGQEAKRLREECTMRVREAVLKVRRHRGWADEDPKARLVDTWREEGRTTQREGKMKDGSWVKDT